MCTCSVPSSITSTYVCNIVVVVFVTTSVIVHSIRIKQDLLPLATSLCQDVDFEVRSCMCRQLDPIAQSLG